MARDNDDKKSKDAGKGSDGKESGGKEEVKKGGLLANKKRLIMIVAPVLLLVGGGGFWFLGPGAGESVEPPPEPGEVVVLEPITVNLVGGHYLKFGLALQATKEVAEAPDGSKAIDLAISTLSNKSMAELSTSEKREEAKHELAEKIEHAYEGEIMSIYFTEFVME